MANRETDLESRCQDDFDTFCQLLGDALLGAWQVNRGRLVGFGTISAVDYGKQIEIQGQGEASFATALLSTITTSAAKVQTGGY